ncbi:MAG: MMPL family transporter [Bacteroidia bacterium]|nr:MMPL family transporter [Bacteroidia bacterium]
MIPKRQSLLVLLLILMGTVFMAFQIPKLTFDYDIENFFPIGSEETAYFDSYREIFGSDNDFILIAIKPSSGIFNQSFLQNLQQLTDSLESHPLIEKAYSLSNIYDYKFIPGFRRARKIPFIHPKDASKMDQDSLKLMQHPVLPGYLIAPDGSSVLIYLSNKAFADADECKSLNRDLREILSGFEVGNYYLSGKCIGQSTFANTIQKEIGIFIIASVLVIMLVLFIMFRSLPALILPLIVVGLAVLWTIATMVLLDRPLSLVSNIIPSMLLVIGVSDVIHLLSHYISLRKNGWESQKALKEAIRKVGIATLLTSITTILGFLSLLSTRFFLLHELGLFASLGVFLALIMTYAIIPALIQFFPQIRFSNTSVKQRLHDFLVRLFHFTQEHAKRIVLASMGLLLLFAFLTTYLEVNIFLLTDLRKEHPLVQDFSFISDSYGGSRPQEISVKLRDSSEHIFSPQVLAELDRVEAYLENEYKLQNINSPLSFIKSANQVFNSGRSSAYQIPDSNTLQFLLSQNIEEEFKANSDRILFSSDYSEGRIMGFLPDLGSRKVYQMNADFHRFLEEELPERKCEYRFTGTSHLLELNTEFLAMDILSGLTLAILGISLFMGLVLRSAKVVLIALLPNILPLLCLAAIMAIFGISIKISTAIIFLIALGISVDDSIHFLSHYRLERKENGVLESVKNTYIHTGRAIILTSVILSLGFLVLCLSNFLGTFYIGALVALSMILALIADLLLLPALILLFLKE